MTDVQYHVSRKITGGVTVFHNCLLIAHFLNTLDTKCKARQIYMIKSTDAGLQYPTVHG